VPNKDRPSSVRTVGKVGLTTCDHRHEGHRKLLWLPSLVYWTTLFQNITKKNIITSIDWSPFRYKQISV